MDMRWRYLLSPPLPGARNMALDDALLERARETGEAVLRVYGWLRPTLSLGRHQTAAGCYDVARAAALGIDVVRRPTGGRAVLHHREATYSVTGPAGQLGDLRESCARINRLLIVGLRSLGADVREARSSSTPPAPGVAPCFAAPVAGELVAGERKLVGSAQWRERGALLQHGSILIDDDQALASSLLLRSQSPPPSPATLRALLGRAPALDEIAAALVDALRASEGNDVLPLSLEPSRREALTEAEARYTDDEWTWRR